ncbi:hypothetical protein Tco_1060995, partial [Tanacetum coccineum]
GIKLMVMQVPKQILMQDKLERNASTKGDMNGQGEAADTNRLNIVSLSVNIVSPTLLLWIQEEKEPKGISLKVCLDKKRMLMAITPT